MEELHRLRVRELKEERNVGRVLNFPAHGKGRKREADGRLERFSCRGTVADAPPMPLATQAATRSAARATAPWTGPSPVTGMRCPM